MAAEARALLQDASSPQQHARLIQEEAGVGWVLLEKLDDTFAVFKKPRGMRDESSSVNRGDGSDRLLFGSVLSPSFLLLKLGLVLVVLGVASFTGMAWANWPGPAPRLLIDLMAAVSAVVAATLKEAGSWVVGKGIPSYTAAELDGNWEFKMLRLARVPAFGNWDASSVLAREGRPGWQLESRISRSQVRLRRLRQQAVSEGGSSYETLDPWRTVDSEPLPISRSDVVLIAVLTMMVAVLLWAFMAALPTWTSYMTGR